MPNNYRVFSLVATLLAIGTTKFMKPVKYGGLVKKIPNY